MSKEIILLKDSYLYKGKKYTKDEFMAALNKIKSKIKIIIAEDEIFITKYNLNDCNIERFLEEVMEDNETYNENILTDYYFNRKSKVLYVYSLNEGRKVKEIYLKKGNVKVMPIQFYIQSFLKFNLYKKKKVLILAEIDKVIYSICCEKAHITYSNLIIDTNFDISKELIKFDEGIDVFLDKSLASYMAEEDFKNYNIEIKSIGRIIYEKLYKV